MVVHEGRTDFSELQAELARYQQGMATLDTVDPEPLPAGHWMYAHPKVRFDRAHFKEISGGSYVFEVIYWVLDRESSIYMDTQQAIKLATLSLKK